MDIFKLISRYIEYCEKHPETVNNTGSALYLYLLNLNNKLGWPDKFGLPREFVMTILGTSSHKTYTKAVQYLIESGFLKQVSASKNQHQSNVFALVKFTTASTIARLKQVPELDRSKSCIDIPIKTNKDYIKNPSEKARAGLYVDYLNKIFEKKYQLTDKVIGNFKARISKYSADELKAVVDNLKKSTYHIDTNFRFCTPEFCLREAKIEMYKSGPIIQKPQNGKNETPEPPKKQDYSEMDAFYKSYTGQDSTSGD